MPDSPPRAQTGSGGDGAPPVTSSPGVGQPDAAATARLRRDVARQARRMDRARRQGKRTVWFSLGMMGMVLLTSNLDAAAPYTGMFAGLLLAVFIAVEAPFSGMSLNPARTLGSALVAREARGLWIYFTAPPLAMLAAAGLYTAAWGAAGVYCAKLNHRGQERCIFDCQIERLSRPSPSPAAVRGITQDATPDHRAAGAR